MSQTDTKERVIRTLGKSDEPVMSASMIAEEMDVSVKTVNNHVDDLIEDGRIETSQIGNATAYYLASSDVYGEGRGTHTCGRCGRKVSPSLDFAKIEYETYFVHRNPEDSTSTFYIFCRFCYADFISWIEDPNAIGSYPFVHSWDIPDPQLEEVREDDDTPTSPGREFLGTDEEAILDIIEDLESEYDDGVPEEKVKEVAVDRGMRDWEVEQHLQKLREGGHALRTISSGLPPGMVYQSAK